MTRWIGRLHKLDWVQWLALIAVLCAYVCIAIPFFGLMPQRAGDIELLLLFLCSMFVALSGRSASAKSGSSGLEHVGGAAIVMMALWTLPAWPFPRPRQPDDFLIFLWSFVVMASATRILSAKAPDRGNASGGAEKSLD